MEEGAGLSGVEGITLSSVVYTVEDSLDFMVRWVCMDTPITKAQFLRCYHDHTLLAQRQLMGNSVVSMSIDIRNVTWQTIMVT